MVVEPIQDIDSTEVYIKDLENEVDDLQKLVKQLKQQLNDKPVNTDYKERYNKLLSTFHKLLDEVIPF